MKTLLKDYRDRVPLGQDEVAARLGVDKSTVCRHEGKNPRFNLLQLEEYAELYGCSPTDLLDGPHLLTDDEKRLLGNFRRLSSQQQRLLVGTIESLQRTPLAAPA